MPIQQLAYQMRTVNLILYLYCQDMIQISIANIRKASIELDKLMNEIELLSQGYAVFKEENENDEDLILLDSILLRLNNIKEHYQKQLKINSFNLMSNLKTIENLFINLAKNDKNKFIVLYKN